jgi:hypothetical protein
MVVVLDGGEFILKLALVVVVHQRDHADDFFARLPFFINQRLRINEQPVSTPL